MSHSRVSRGSVLELSLLEEPIVAEFASLLSPQFHINVKSKAFSERPTLLSLLIFFLPALHAAWLQARAGRCHLPHTGQAAAPGKGHAGAGQPTRRSVQSTQLRTATCQQTVLTQPNSMRPGSLSWACCILLLGSVSANCTSRADGSVGSNAGILECRGSLPGKNCCADLDKLHSAPGLQSSMPLLAGVPRLFDLVRVRDKRMGLAFYFALRDTVVAAELEQASRIAYGADRRWARVVTLKVGHLLAC